MDDAPIKVLLDTDIGDDIDDALALAYALAEPRINLLGVTTVSETDDLCRARLASVFCRAAHQAVQIVPGAARPLLVEPIDAKAPQREMLSRWPHEDAFEDVPAAWFLRETILRHPHEIVLLAIGPLTNVALLLAMDPSIGSKLRALVMMGGCFDDGALQGRAEWNLRSDPHAGGIVAAGDLPLRRWVGYDITQQVAQPVEQVMSRAQAAGQEALAACCAVYGTYGQTAVYHDPLAMATLLEPSVCDLQRGHVRVESETGRTRFVADPEGIDEIAASVRADAMLAHYWQRFDAVELPAQARQ